MKETELDRLRRYPYLTYLQVGEIAVLGVVQNVGPQTVNVFDFAHLRTDEQRKGFLKLAEEWWFESNTQVPIDVFLGPKFDYLLHCLRIYPRSAVIDVQGPLINLDDQFKRRIRRRRIEFIKAPPRGVVKA